MSFYGNITNTAKTTFQFDRIYPNRLQMDAGANKDGIYLGRYVLVEYENNNSKDCFIRATKINKVSISGKEGDFYTLQTSNDIETTLKFDSNLGSQYDKLAVDKTTNLNVGLDWIVYVEPEDHKIDDKTRYFIAIGDVVADDNAVFRLASATDSTYKANFDIDTYRYNDGKGFDSTVWMKSSVVLDDKLETKYVQIAELNTVVPTFDLTIDAPTSEPITPHFDTDSTNVYYKLHVQPNWGFKVKQSEDKSDEFTYWTKQVKVDNGTNDSLPTYKTQYAYLEENSIVWRDTKPDKDSVNIPASIYYNKNAFTEYIEDGQVYQADDKTVNTVTLLPTGKSGAIYNTHKAGEPNQAMEDTQELTIYLPAIGNMMYNAWNIIHGENRDDNPKDTLQGRLDFFTGNIISNPDGGLNINRDANGKPIKSPEGIKANEIPVQSEKGYLVGSKINGANEFKFKIKDDGTLENIGDIKNISNTDFNSDDAWIKTQVNTAKVNDESPYHVNGISIHHDWHKYKDTWSYRDLNEDKVIENVNQSDTVNPNDWGVKPEDSIIQYTPFVDAAGHIVGEDLRIVKLPNGYKTITTEGSSDITTDLTGQTGGSTIAKETQGVVAIDPVNEWLQVKIRNDIERIELAHKLTPISINHNQDYGLSQDETIATLDTDNKFEVPVFQFDEAGHITKAETHTVELPENFDKIKFNQSNDINDKTSSTQTEIKADSIIDTLTLSEGNKWIYIDSNDNDEVTISHYVENFNFTDPIDVNFDASTAGETFTAVDSINWDEAGHLIEVRKSTYELPKAYQLITSTNSDSVTMNGKYTDGSSKAETTRDGFALNSGNRWININNNNNQIITLEHAAPGQASASAGQTANSTPAFGETFKVSEINFDQAGHINNAKTHIVTLPKPSLTSSEAGAANVVTSLSLLDEGKDGKFIQTTKNVGLLQLTGYSQGNDNSNVSPTDTINSAFGKLQTQIIEEEQARAADINRLIGGATEAFDTLREVEDWLSNSSNKDAADIIADINSNSNAISAEAERATEVEEALENELSQAKLQLQNNIDNLSTTVGNNKTATDNSISSLSNRVQALENKEIYTKTEVNELIEGLEATIADLISRIEALENPTTE